MPTAKFRISTFLSFTDNKEFQFQPPNGSPCLSSSSPIHLSCLYIYLFKKITSLRLAWLLQSFKIFQKVDYTWISNCMPSSSLSKALCFIASSGKTSLKARLGGTHKILGIPLSLDMGVSTKAKLLEGRLCFGQHICRQNPHHSAYHKRHCLL